MIDSLVQDLKYALRSLVRTPRFTAAAVLTLALGIGANTAMFSVADATALRPPDVPRPGEIVRVFTSSKDTPYGEVSYPDFLAFRAATKTLSGLVGYETGDFALASDPQQPANYLGGWLVTANFFSVLGVEPAIGRGFLANEETLASNVAVISHRLWERDFQMASDIVGRRVVLSGALFTIVGVAPERFTSTELYFHPDIFACQPGVRLRHARRPAGPDHRPAEHGSRLSVRGRAPGTTRGGSQPGGLTAGRVNRT